MEEDDVNLATYLVVPLRRWKLTLGLAVVGAAAGVAFHAMRPPEYKAKAGVAIVHSRMEIPIEIPGVTEEKRKEAPTAETVRQEAATRRQTLVAFVQNELIEERVRQQLAHDLTAEEGNPGALTGMVEGTLAEDRDAEHTKSDMVQIVVTGREPVKLALIANAWAGEYEKLVNETYGVLAASQEEMDRKVDEARKTYEAAQKAVLEFSSRDFEREGEREIDEKEKTLRALRSARVTEAKDACEMRDHVDRLLFAARALRVEAQKGGNAESATLALMLLKAEAHAGASFSDKGKSNFHVDSLSGMKPTDYVKDVEALVAGLEAEEKELDARIQARVSGADQEAPLSKQIAALEAELKEVAKRKEADKTKGREIEAMRDMALRAFEATERLALLSRTPGGEVRFAVRAAVPTIPVSLGRVQCALGGLLAGLVAGGLLAYIIEFGGSPPRRAA